MVTGSAHDDSLRMVIASLRSKLNREREMDGETKLARFKSQGGIKYLSPKIVHAPERKYSNATTKQRS